MPNSNSTFSSESFGVRYSSAMNGPPEIFHKANSNDKKSYLKYWGQDISQLNPELAIIKTKRGSFLPKVFDVEAVNMDGR